MTPPDPPLTLPPNRWILGVYGLGLGPAILLSALYAGLRYAPPVWGGWALGWTVAAAGAAAGLLIKISAVGGDLTRFLIWGLLINGGRAGFFLLIIVAANRSDMAGFRPFVVAVFSGYFTSMICEIAILHAMTIGGTNEHE